MLAKSTIAGQEGVITYLANAAALQQFEQASLAYVLMSEAGRPMSDASLAAAAESLLEGRFQVGNARSMLEIYNSAAASKWAVLHACLVVTMSDQLSVA